jgi:class 3 adenylate cyclase
MFCDLVAFTPLSQRLDPEELREIVRAHQEACSEVIRHFDGHVAQLLGDGLLVYFGWPQAHEDDAQRAVRAGLRLLDATAALSGRLPHVGPDTQLAVRVGIHTGLVVVGAMGGAGREERLALGDTPNIASRIQGLAAPDTVVISAATHRLVQGYFTIDDLGTHPLKGVTEHVPLPCRRPEVVNDCETRTERI